MLRDFWDGIKYVWMTPLAFTMVGLSFAFGFFGAAYVQVLPAFGKDVLRLNADGAGFLLTVAGIGSLAGNIYLASLGNARAQELAAAGDDNPVRGVAVLLRADADLHPVAGAAVLHGGGVYGVHLDGDDGACR